MSLTHKEKDDIIKELKEKLESMKSVEEQITLTAAELSQYGFGICKDSVGDYQLVKLKFDIDKNTAAIDGQDNLGKDVAIVLYKAKQYLVETVIKKAKGGKYVE